MSQKISVSLEEKHRRIVERYGKKIGVSAFSTALQALIYQFDQSQRAAEQPAPPALEPTTPEPTAA